MGSSGSRECDTGCGGKVGGPRLTIWHCGLTVVDTATFLPHHICLYQSAFSLWELMFYKVEDVEGRHGLGEQEL